MHIVLNQVHRLASSSRHSKELALASMQDELQKACAMIEKLRIGLEVGKVSSLVKDLRKETQQMEKETKKPLSYAEAARRGTISHPPTTAKGTTAWSLRRTFFLRPQD